MFGRPALRGRGAGPRGGYTDPPILGASAPEPPRRRDEQDVRPEEGAQGRDLPGAAAVAAGRCHLSGAPVRRLPTFLPALPGAGGREGGAGSSAATPGTPPAHPGAGEPGTRRRGHDDVQAGSVRVRGAGEDPPGATALADAGRVTLGPRSKSVLIEKRFGAPVVCNDGVTIAKEMALEDPTENPGAQIIRQAAERTREAVGDGTSTATVLTHAIFADGAKNIVAGASGVDLKRGLDRRARVAVEALRALSRPVASRVEKAQVATISAHNGRSIGELVAEAMEKVGDEGVITVEESKTTETQLEVVEGLQFDRGYISPYFVTDPEKMEAVTPRPSSAGPATRWPSRPASASSGSRSSGPPATTTARSSRSGWRSWPAGWR